MKSICFVSHNIYPLIAKLDNIPFIGGAELQQSILGGVFRNNGWRVKYVTGVYNKKSQNEIIDEFRVIKTFADSEGIRGMRFLCPRLIKLLKALKVADCDYYYQRGAGFSTGIIAHFCRKYKKKFIYSGASDTDFIPSEIKVPYLIDKILYKWGIKKARGREHYQTEKFEWKRSGLTIQMQDANEAPIDERIPTRASDEKRCCCVHYGHQ